MLAELEGAKEPLERAVSAREVPSAVAITGTADTRWLITASGVRRYDQDTPVDRDTRYDLASLTKVVATLPAVLKLIDEQEVHLSDPVKRFFSNAGWFKTPSLGEVTLIQLLTHTSGLPAWTPLFAQTNDPQVALANVLQTGLETPPGPYLYSDHNFILLGAIIERVSKMRLDAFAHQYVFASLGITHTSFGPVTGEVAATEDCGWRGVVLEGTVHDENAYVLGGVAGHVGLFGTADDLATYAQAWLKLDERLASEEILLKAREPYVQVSNTLKRGLAWQLGQGETQASALSFSHTGFTGTSLFIDPEGGWFAVLLTNRVHPSRDCGRGIGKLRIDFHNAVARAFQAETSG